MKKKSHGFFARLRTWTSLASTWLLNLGMFGVTFKQVCSPGFNCHGCPWASFACPIGVFAFSSSMARIPLFAISSILFVGALVGRLVCSFACPFGFFQELMHRIPSKKLRLPKATRLIKYAALALLVFILPFAMGWKPLGFIQVMDVKVEKSGGDQLSLSATVKNPGTEPVASPALHIVFKDRKTGAEDATIVKAFPELTVAPGESAVLPPALVRDRLSAADLTVDSPQGAITQKLPWDFLYFCRICPAGTLTATIPGYFTTPPDALSQKIASNALRLGVLLFFLVLMVLVSRPFCRTLCPLGAIYGLTSRFALTRMQMNHDACVNCGQCDKACPVDLDVRKEIGGAECIACGDCRGACAKSAISRKIGL